MYDRRSGMTLSEAIEHGADWRDNSPYRRYGMRKPSFASFLNMQATTAEELDRLTLEGIKSGFANGMPDYGGARPVQGALLGQNYRNAATYAQMKGGADRDWDDPEIQHRLNRQQSGGGFGQMNPFNSRVYGYAHLPELNGIDPAEANYMMEHMRPYEKNLEASWPQNAGKAGIVYNGDITSDLPDGVKISSFNDSNGAVHYSNTGAGGQISRMAYDPSTGSWGSTGYLNSPNATPWNANGGKVLGGPGGYIPSQPFGQSGNVRSYNSSGPGKGWSNDGGHGSLRNAGKTIMRNDRPGNYGPYTPNESRQNLDRDSYYDWKRTSGATAAPFGQPQKTNFREVYGPWNTRGMYDSGNSSLNQGMLDAYYGYGGGNYRAYNPYTHGREWRTGGFGPTYFDGGSY